MKRRYWAFAVVVVLVSVLAALAQGGDNKEFRKTVEFESGGRLTLDTYKGSIHLSPWDRNQVEVVARIEAGEHVSQEYAERSVEATRVEVWGSASSLTIRSDYEDVPCRDRWWFGGCSKVLPYIHYEIRAPRKLSIRLDDHKSETDISGFEGDFDLDTHKGEVKLANLSGEIRLETHKGRVEASELSGDIRLNTHKGRMNLTGVRGRVRAETHKGDVSIDAVELEGKSRLETYKGTIALRVPESQGFDIRGDVGRRGYFQSDFEVTLRTFGRRRRRGEQIEGRVSGGGPEIYVNTYRGEIRLRRR
ncbi:MAG: DUF4097 domain-containing protein [Terriglobia bacterium]